MGICFIKSGVYTTIQDSGRNGCQSLGFSVSGVMDKKAFVLANMLLDNKPDTAALEFTVTGPCIQFLSDTFIALTGGDFLPKLNGALVENYRAVQVKKGDVLELGPAQKGMWGYLSFAGGMNIKSVLGSCSTNTRCAVGGFHGRKIQKGDYIRLSREQRYLPNFVSRKIRAGYLKNYSADSIRVIEGPQSRYFTKAGLDTFFRSRYSVTSQCDRMGYRLEGDFIEHKKSGNQSGADIISDGISLGAVQVPAHGKPIVMLADRQTTGGYTKIANVATVDLPVLVQKKPGETVHFQMIDIRQAQRLLKEQAEEFKNIQRQIHLPCKEVLEPRTAAQRMKTILAVPGENK